MPENSESLKSCLKKSFSQSTFHSLNRITQDGCWKRRVFWAIVLSTFSITMLIQVAAILDSFMRNETTTSIKTVTEEASVFPIVTICDLDQITKDLAIELQNQAGWTEYNASNITDTSKNYLGFFSGQSEYNLNGKFSFVSSLGLMNDSVLEKLQSPINETILSCDYNNKYCDANDFSHVINPFFGSCIQFKASENLKFSGSLNGLNLDILLDPRNEKNHLYDERGLVILITNKTQDIDNTKAVYVPVKEKSLIEIKRVYTNNLPKPFTDCIKINEEQTSEFYNIIKIMNKSYTREYCLNICQAKYIAQNCSCFIKEFYHFNREKICSKDDFSCFNTVYRTVISSLDLYCGGKCPRECEYFEYTKSISSSTFSSDYYAGKLLSVPFVQRKYPKLSKSELKENLISLSLYFKKLQYEEIQQLPAMTFTDFISSFGGTLGLFVGASLISLFELVEGCLIVTKHLYKDLRKRNATHGVRFKDSGEKKTETLRLRVPITD